MKAIETAIVAAAREVLGNGRVRLKDLMEWKSAPIMPHAGEVVIEVDALDMHWWAAFPASCDKRQTPPEGK